MSRFSFDSQIASVAAGASTILFTMKIPKTVNAKVTGISTFIRDNAALGQIRWKLLYDGTPVLPFEDIKTLIGEEGKLLEVPEEYKTFPGGGSLEVVAFNDNASIPFEAGAALRVRFDNPVDLVFVKRSASVQVPARQTAWDLLRRFF